MLDLLRRKKKKGMDSEAIEQAIDEELEKLSLNLSDVSDVDSDGDTDTEDDFDASNRKLENDLPQSVLTYFEASHNRVNTFEQLILEDLDLDENDTACTELSHQNHFENLLNELDCNPEEDLTELKERIISEIEEHVAYPSDGSCLEDTKPALHMNDETECGVYKEAERQLIYEWVELEEKLKKEEEQRLAELEAEKEHHLNSVREEEEKRRCRLEEFEEELRKIENTCLVSEDLGGDSHIKERIQLELAKQQEVIKKLEEQLEEEKRAYEEAQQEERRKTEEQRSGAATKLQAALRGVLVRRWSKNELIKRKEEVRRRQEEIEERERRREREERMKKEREEERKRVAAEEQHQKEELERRRVEYERAKERERHRLEKERKLEEQRRREEEAKRMEDERKRKGDEERTKRMEEERKEEERRRLEEEERKLKEEKKKEELESKQMQKERKQLEEKESKGKEGEVIERDGWTMEERGMRQKEKRKGMEEHRMCTESSVDDENRKRKDKEKKKEELESKQMQKERKQLEEKESKEEDGKVKKRIEEKDEQTMEERRMREEERGKRMEEERTEEEERRVEEERRKSKEGKSKKLEEEKKKKKEQLEGKVMQEEQRKNLAEKQSEEEEGKVMKRNEKRDGHELEERTREEHRKSVLKEDGKGLDDQRCFLKTGSKNTKKNSEKGGKEERSAELVPQPCLSQSNKSPNGISASPKSSSYGHHQICSADPTDNNIALMAPALDGAQLEVKMYVEKSEMDTRGHPCETASSIQNCAQNTRSICLPDSTEQKRLSWMMNCTPWSKLSMQTKRKGLTAPSRKRAIRRPSLPILPPLPVDTVLKSGPWSTLRQVTTVTLEDLPGFSLSTLSECTSLQSLTLRCCGLQALEGLQQCSELRHIDVQENCITYVDLGGLERLEFLMLGRNQLTSIPGLDSAVNLTVLQLSHNIISRISGLGSLKRLQRLSVDHNQLISTRGLSDAFTLLYLDCSFNHLSHVEGLEHCALLNTLDLRGNSLTELPVLKNHVLLRELYLDDNSISSLHGLDSCWLPLLRCLSVAQNNITQLPLLVDLLSLRTLDISHNCLSELRNVCLSLQGCARLQELNLSDNPLQLENNWRSSVLTAKPSLVKLNGDLTGASVEPSVGSTQLWSFQALCQAHQDQLDSVLQRQSMEISLAPSMLDAQLLARNHGTELFRLAEEQRYAHEYGDSSVSETAAQEPGASSCLHDVSDGDLTKYESPQLHPGEQETQSQRRAHLTGIHKSHPEHQAADLPADCVVGCINPLKKFREEQSGYSRHTIKAARMDLKTMAAIVIQRFWRKHRQSRRTGPSEPPAKANGRWSPQQRAKSNEKSLKPLNKDYAATVIQAVWRGYALRRRLARALALAQISEGDEAFEEVDVDEFIFDEEAMESDWIALHSDASLSGLPPYLEQLLLPKPRLLLPELSTPVLPWKPKQAWTGSEVAVASEQSPDPDIRMQSPPSTRGRGALSERSEKILEEWGISCGSTALLMLKRAKKMKARNQEQKKLLDPAVRLALFRNNSKQPVPINIRKRPQPECKDDIKAGRAEVSVENALSGGPGRLQQHRTYQWLHTQAEQTQRSSDSSTSDRFLPEIDPDILNGGRVQLVAGARYRESPDSAARLWSDATGFSPLCNQHAHVRRHSVGHAKKEVPSPKRVTSAPSRKERISFRDNPVRLSGGWGGGKKRAKVNK